MAYWSRCITLLNEPATTECLRLSLKTTCVALPLLVVVGVPLGYVLGRYRGRWVSFLDFLVTLPLVFPPIATGFLLLILLGRRSAIGVFLRQTIGVEIIFSFSGVVLAAFIAGVPLIVKQVQAAIRGETSRLIEAAYLLGKSPVVTFFLVTIPSLRKNIIIGLSLAFARCLGEVGMTLMLGGNISGRTNTISLEVYNSVFTGEYDRAFVLVAILAVISFFLICFTRTMAKGG